MMHLQKSFGLPVSFDDTPVYCRKSSLPLRSFAVSSAKPFHRARRRLAANNAPEDECAIARREAGLRSDAATGRGSLAGLQFADCAISS